MDAHAPVACDYNLTWKRGLRRGRDPRGLEAKFRKAGGFVLGTWGVMSRQPGGGAQQAKCVHA